MDSDFWYEKRPLGILSSVCGGGGHIKIDLKDFL